MGFRREGNLRKICRMDRSGGQGLTGEEAAAVTEREGWRAGAEGACESGGRHLGGEREKEREREGEGRELRA